MIASYKTKNQTKERRNDVPKEELEKYLAKNIQKDHV